MEKIWTHGVQVEWMRCASLLQWQLHVETSSVQATVAVHPHVVDTALKFLTSCHSAQALGEGQDASDKTLDEAFGSTEPAVIAELAKWRKRAHYWNANGRRDGRWEDRAFEFRRDRPLLRCGSGLHTVAESEERVEAAAGAKGRGRSRSGGTPRSGQGWRSGRHRTPETPRMCAAGCCLSASVAVFNRAMSSVAGPARGAAMVAHFRDEHGLPVARRPVQAAPFYRGDVSASRTRTRAGEILQQYGQRMGR